MSDKKIINSSIEITLDIIGGKYKPLILYILIKDGKKRFNELLRNINSISKKTLVNQLKELEKDGLIVREVFDCKPPKVEYSISDRGLSLTKILDLMCVWGSLNNNDSYHITNDISNLCNNDCPKD